MDADACLSVEEIWSVRVAEVMGCLVRQFAVCLAVAVEGVFSGRASLPFYCCLKHAKIRRCPGRIFLFRHNLRLNFANFLKIHQKSSNKRQDNEETTHNRSQPPQPTAVMLNQLPSMRNSYRWVKSATNLIHEELPLALHLLFC